MKSQDPAPNLNSHRNVFVKQTIGIGALIVCFAVMMLLILGIARVVQGQAMSDSLTHADPFLVETSNVSAERASGATRMPLNSSMIWRENFGKQSALSLRMSNTKGHALQNLIIFATYHGDELDLSDAVPALLRVYEWDSDERFQVMALSALHAIGDEDGMERILTLFADARFKRQRLSPRLRHMTHAALSEYLQTRSD